MARKVEIGPYQPGHGAALVANIREIDRKEVHYAFMLDPGRALAMSVASSVGCWSATVDGEVASVFGVARKSQLSRDGVPWLLGTPVMDTAPASVARHSLVYFDRMSRAFPVLENRVWAENHLAIRWLKWLGFDMEEPKPFGVFGQPYIRFSKGLRNVPA